MVVNRGQGRARTVRYREFHFVRPADSISKPIVLSFHYSERSRNTPRNSLLPGRSRNHQTKQVEKVTMSGTPNRGGALADGMTPDADTLMNTF